MFKLTRHVPDTWKGGSSSFTLAHPTEFFFFFFQVKILEQAGKHKKLRNSGFRTYFLPFDDRNDLYWLTRDIKAPAHLQVV